MRILFIQDNIINESLILTEISAYLKMHGHQTFLLIDREEKNLEREAININPDIFIIPCYQFSLPWVLGIVRRIRKVSSGKIALAGMIPTLFPQIIENEGIDMLFRGETEEAILEVINCLSSGTDIKRVKNIAVKESNGKVIVNPLRRPYPCLDELPLPDRSLYYDRYNLLKNMGIKRFLSGRGCIHNCSFCYNSYFRKTYDMQGGIYNFIRKKSPERIVEEIKYVKSTYPLNHVHFSDDLFCTDENWVGDFCEIYRKEINLPFTCNAAVDLLDENIVKSLKDANCRGIAVGVETGSEDLRFKIMNKEITDSRLREVCALIKKYKLMLVAFNIIANPTETINDAIKTIKLNREIKADCVRVLFAVPIPYTRYAHLGIQEGFFSEQELFDFFVAADSKYTDRVFFRNEYGDSWLTLYSIFYLMVKLPIPGWMIRRFILLPRNKFLNKVLRPLQFLNLFAEKKFFGMKYLEAVNYYLRGGNPYKDRKNAYPSFI